MTSRIFKSGIIFIVCACAVLSEQARAQRTVVEEELRFAERNLGGPRLGVTFVPGNSTLVQKLKDKNIGTLISQFGWHFEYQVIPEGGGPSFVIQTIPFIGGVEYGTIIPSATLAMGVRLPEGIEIGMGPNILIGGGGKLATSLVFAVGKSINYGGVSIPINVAVATSRDGNRFSIIFGYAITSWGK